MRAILLYFAFLSALTGFAQQRPLTEKEKLWVDSLNDVLGYKNPWFDSLMKVDGKCSYVVSRDHWMQGDTTPDIISYRRNLYSGSDFPTDAHAYASFDYYPSEKKIVTNYGPEIYLQPGGAVILEFNYTSWSGIQSVLLRRGNDTLFTGNHERADTVLPGLTDTSKNILICGAFAAPVIMTLVAGEEKSRIRDRRGKTIHLLECRFINSMYPALSETYPVFEQPFIVAAGDSLCALLHPGDTLFTECDAHWTRDAQKKINFSYFTLCRIYPFGKNDIERLIMCSGMIPAQPVPYPPLKKEKRAYLRFTKRNPKKNDPDGIYRDPVIRWLYREKIYTYSER